MSSAIKAKPPPRVNPSPQKIHIAYSARLVRFVYLSQLRLGIIPNVTFCVYSAGDRSGPRILRLQFQRIVFTLLNFPEGTLFNRAGGRPSSFKGVTDGGPPGSAPFLVIMDPSQDMLFANNKKVHSNKKRRTGRG